MEFVELLSNLTIYMWHVGLVTPGHDALKAVMNVYRQMEMSEEDERWSDVYCRLGIILSSKGVRFRKESQDCRYKMLTIRRKAKDAMAPAHITRDDEMRLCNAESDVAFTFLHEERFAEIEPIMEKCLIQYKKWDSKEDNLPFEYCKYYFCMSFVRMAQQKPEEAVSFAERANELIGAAAGSEHPMTQLFKMSLGTILYHAGAIERAWEVNEAVRQTRLKLSGEANHNTLESYSTCAALLEKLDRNIDAE